MIYKLTLKVLKPIARKNIAWENNLNNIMNK